jgi:hypothetical protein
VAAENGRVEAIETPLEAGAEVNHVDTVGVTALFAAA